MSKRIFFLPGAYDGCYYYRGYLPGLFSRSMIMTEFNSVGYDTETMKKRADIAEAIVIQRPNDKIREGLAKEYKKAGKKIIFENDDTYLPEVGVPLSIVKTEKQKAVLYGMQESISETLKIADMAIATTEFLANEYRKLNKNVVVLKNCINPDDYYKCKENTTGKYRIAFIGSVSTNDDYVHIKEDIRKLDERGDVTIVVFGVKQKKGEILGAYQEDYDFWSTLKNVEWQSFVPIQEYYKTIANLAIDLAIIPRKDNYFNRCKSNLKFLECSLLKIPVIAQGFNDNLSPYQVNKQDTEHMDIVLPRESWYNRIVNLLEDVEKRKLMAKKANIYVLENYNVKNYAAEWRKQIEKLWNQHEK